LITSISNPATFNNEQLQIAETALSQAVALWESKITGYQDGIALEEIPITVSGSTTGFASAQVVRSTFQGGFHLTTEGRINVNVEILEPFSDFEGTGLNVIDELMAHEIAHALGFGTHWIANGVYQLDSGRYTGEFALAAYRSEFDPAAEFVPVELAGGPGTRNSHWDQLMRSSAEEGDPSDPFSLDPRVGITDMLGRDLALELMTGAIDPDFGEPFLSRTTIQSMRDIGFTVVPEPSSFAICCTVVIATAVGRGYFRRRRGLRGRP